MVWAAALSAGSSLIGGLLGMNSQRKAESRARAYAAQERAYNEQRESTQFVRMRDAARAGGFNPSSVLGAGGAAGFQQHYNPTLSFASTGGYIQGMMENVGGFFQAAYDQDPLEERRALLELDIMEAELQRITQTGGRAGYGQVPTATGSRLQETHGDYANNPWPLDSGYGVDTNLPDAGIAEERYGEPGEWYFGLRNLLGDYTHNNPGASRRPAGTSNSRRPNGDGVHDTDLGSVSRHFGSWMLSGLRTANQRARINNRLDTYRGW